MAEPPVRTTEPAPGPREQARALRLRLASAGPLGSNPIGTVPILWNDMDGSPRRPASSPEAILDDIARTAYDGCQMGAAFPEGAALRAALDARDLRLAEVYAAIPATVDGPVAHAMADLRERLALLVAGGGEVLCVAIDGTPERDAVAGRADDPATPRLTDAGWIALIRLLRTIAAETAAVGARIAFHPHAGTYVETPLEVARLTSSIEAETLPLCLDVGHWIVAGGDPLEALATLGDRVSHVHLKDVDGGVLRRLRAGQLDGLDHAVRERVFTELGSGILDLDGVLAALAGRGYAGWLMVEQDSGWPPPAESAAIGRHVLAASIRRLG